MTNVSDPVIDIQRLHKRYGRQVALRGIDLTVHRGQIYGFIGPNGAGKTTAMRILLDILRPTAGSVRVLGENPRSGGAALRSRIGYLPGELRLEGRYDVATLLDHYAGLSGPGGAKDFAWRPLAERVGLDGSRQVRGLSKGNKQKVGLVQAFMHRPELLILDEPTSGLDPLIQQEFLAMAREARDAGQTVFLSSHVLSEIEHVADRVTVLRQGEVVLTSTVSELRNQLGVHCTVQLAQPVAPAEFTGLPGVRSVTVSPHNPTTLRIKLTGGPDALVKALSRHTVLDLTVEHPDLEAIVMGLYRPTRQLASDADADARAGTARSSDVRAERGVSGTHGMPRHGVPTDGVPNTSGESTSRTSESALR